MKFFASIVVACCAVIFSMPVGADLTVGDPAPKLAQGEYVRGQPVTEFEKGKVYVVEMWATWCGPCVMAIPHLTELQKKYADQEVIIIGQNVWENDESKVKPFLEKMGDKMAYRVALDDKTQSTKGQMAETWMVAAKQRGIPCTFIINQEGTIAWIGHPMAMDEALANVVAKKHDIAQARAEHDKNMTHRKVAMELNVLMRESKWDEVLAKIEDVGKSDPKLGKRFDAMRFKALTERKQSDKAKALVEEVLKNVKDDPQTAMQIAEEMMTAKDHEGALRLAEAAAPHAEMVAYWAYDIQARAHAANKDWAKAVEARKKSIEGAPDDVKQRMEPTLKSYEAKAAAK